MSYILAGNHPYYLGDQNENKLSNEELHCRLVEADESELIQFKQTEQKLKCAKNNSKFFSRSVLNSDCESLDSQLNEINDLDLVVGQNEDVFSNETQTDKLDSQFNEFSFDDKLIDDKIVSKSLMERNLEYLSSGLSGRSVNPVSIFLDQLQHPDADIGENKPSLLKWVYNSKNKIDHLVIGKGLPGGAWQKFHDCDEILTISLSKWMQLPNYSIDEWCRKLKNYDVTLNNRVALSNIAEYYQDYVQKQNLESNFINHCQVKKVNYCEKLNIWCVYCKNEITKEKLVFTCNNIVLATGNSDVPNKLNVHGEDQWFVKHYLNDLEDLLKGDKLDEEKEPILIIGNYKKILGASLFIS